MVPMQGSVMTYVTRVSLFPSVVAAVTASQPLRTDTSRDQVDPARLAPVGHHAHCTIFRKWRKEEKETRTKRKRVPRLFRGTRVGGEVDLTAGKC